jgi:hypothetical protein
MEILDALLQPDNTRITVVTHAGSREGSGAHGANLKTPFVIFTGVLASRPTSILFLSNRLLGHVIENESFGSDHNKTMRQNKRKMLNRLLLALEGHYMA